MANSKELEVLLLKLTVKVDELTEQVKELKDAFEKQPKVASGSVPFKRYRNAKETMKFLGCSYQMIKDYTAKGAFKLANGSRDGAPQYDCYQLVDAISRGEGGKLSLRLDELMLQLPNDWQYQLLKSPPVAGFGRKMPQSVRLYVEQGKKLMEAE